MISAADLPEFAQELRLSAEDLALIRNVDLSKVFDGADEAAAEAVATWLEDPVAFVREVFDAEPDEWQKAALIECVKNPRVAMKACKGPGKSAVLAWFGWWCLALHEDANGYALSITEKNLRDNLWKEMALWYARSPWLQREFSVSGERITHREHKDTWWLSARAFAQDADPTQQANTLAGLHAKFVFILCDESSDYPDGVMSAGEGIFANEGIEAHLVQSGNPTRCEGPLYNACTRDRARWVVIEITGDPEDPKRSPRISMAYAQEAIDSYGRDNPWVMINILGQFPPTQENKLLGPNDITRAEGRDPGSAAWMSEPIIWALDCSRFGTDESVLQKRQGPIAFRAHCFRNLDGPELASRVSYVIREDAKKPHSRMADYLFVDVTGLGASPFDQLKLLGWGDRLIAVEFGSSPDNEWFADKRAEMWSRMANWVRKFGSLPSHSAQLGADLCGPTFKIDKRGKRTCFILESKEDMRKRGMKSPDRGDALAMTFYTEHPIRRDAVPDVLGQLHTSGRAVTEYQRFAPSAGTGRAVTDYRRGGR